MFIASDQYVGAYDNIRVNAGEYKQPVIIFVAPDEDALLALRCISLLFKQDNIPYKTILVGSDQELTDAVERQCIPVLNDEIHSIILLNCGASLNLPAIFRLDDEDSRVTVYVLDYHRPFLLENAHYRNEALLLMVDSVENETDEDLLPPLPTEEELGEDKAVAEEESDNEAEADEDLDPVSRAKRRRRREEEENDPDLKRVRENCRRRKHYYRQNYYGASSALQALLIADNLGRRRSDFVWYAAVGLVRMLMRQRLDTTSYNKAVETISEALENTGSAPAEDSQVPDANHANFQEHRVTFQNEYKFTLLTYWTLYESMLNSPFVAAKLGTHREAGRNNLHMLLAKVGISIKDAKQPYSQWTKPMKKRLEEGLDQYADQFELADYNFPSYCRRVGFLGTIAASDLANALAATIELGVPEVDGPASAAGGRQAADWRSKFWQAYDMLETQSLSFRRGIDRAIQVQQAVMSTGRAILEKRMVVHVGPFRYSVVDDIAEDFAQPAALERLALFLVEALRSSQSKLKPLLVCALRGDHYICVGVCAPADSGNTEPNKFNAMFRLAKRDTGAAVDSVNFDPHVCKVAKSDFQRWLDVLHSSGTSHVSKRARRSAG